MVIEYCQEITKGQSYHGKDYYIGQHTPYIYL
jgi:hypothetical protein